MSAPLEKAERLERLEGSLRAALTDAIEARQYEIGKHLAELAQQVRKQLEAAVGEAEAQGQMDERQRGGGI